MHMKNHIKRCLKTGAKALGLHRLFWYVFRLLDDSPISISSGSVSDGEIFGTFRDSRGHDHPLYDGHRNRLKPDWRAMFQPPAEISQTTSKTAAGKSLDDWHNRISRVQGFLSLCSATIEGKKVVEIGAYGGATSFALALAGATRVIGTDIAAYYIQQTPGGDISAESVAAKNSELSTQRQAFRQAVGEDVSRRVSFVEDDICSSTLGTESADAILSWEVLEHVKDPACAFEQMYRVLQPGGIAFHEYNPFFSQDGGHSLCTLDFPWGHARISPQDFERYLREIRPSEHEVARAFFRENLNRMTIADLQRYATGAGFDLLSVLPWTESQHLNELPTEALSDTMGSYPSCQLTDLISPTVWVLMRKN
jgi:SAM-dependent methyltransferase